MFSLDLLLRNVVLECERQHADALRQRAEAQRLAAEADLQICKHHAQTLERECGRLAEELAFRDAQLASLHGRPKQPRARARVLPTLLPFTLRSTRK